MLEGWLEFYRATLLWKCAGLSSDQLKQASCPPSNLTLLGLVRHMAKVERVWFRQRLAGETIERLYSTDQRPDADFENLSEADAEADIATFQAELAAARRAATGRSLEESLVARDIERNLRWLYLHMIEEYARHCGHADLVRERIDGATGY
jgi:uncharacterized damage-inducible protein DinB